MTSPSNYLTVAEAADRLAVSVQRIYALIKSDRLKAIRLGKVWLVELESVENRLKASV